MLEVEHPMRKFRETVGSPEAAPARSNWAEVEKELGLKLPPDYKLWGSQYSSIFVDSYLRVHNFSVERAAFGSLDLGPLLSGVRDVVRKPGKDSLSGACNEEPFPLRAQDLAFYPEPGGLLYWAWSEEGHYCTWRTIGPPEDWKIVITDGGSWWLYDGSFLNLLVGLLTRTVRCPLFDEDVFETPRIQEAESFEEDGTGYVFNYHTPERWLGSF